MSSDSEEQKQYYLRLLHNKLLSEFDLPIHLLQDYDVQGVIVSEKWTLNIHISHYGWIRLERNKCFNS